MMRLFFLLLTLPFLLNSPAMGTYSDFWYSSNAAENILAASERAGGHLLARHVSQTEAQLSARLAAQPNISPASTFATSAQAEAAVSAALNANRAQIAKWVGSSANGLDPSGLWSWAQTWGVLKVVGGAVEDGAGYSLAVASGAAGAATSWTGIGAVAGAAGIAGGTAIGAHGIDTFQAGIRQAWGGGEVDTFTSQGLQAAGVSRGTANTIDAGISIAGSMGAGGAAQGLHVAGTAGKGLEVSHWMPARSGGPRSLWNGNYVTKEFHALSDPYRYNFMPRAWKEINNAPNVVIQQWNRVPYIYKGMVAGGITEGITHGVPNSKRK